MQHESFTKRQFSRQGVSGMVILGVIIWIGVIYVYRLTERL